MKKYCNFTKWEMQITEMSRKATGYRDFKEIERRKKQTDTDQVKRNEDSKKALQKKIEKETNNADEHVVRES